MERIIYRGYPQGLYTALTAGGQETGAAAETEAAPVTVQEEAVREKTVQEEALWGEPRQEAPVQSATEAAGEPAVQPYMLYRREENSVVENPAQALETELSYFRDLYPLSVRGRQAAAEEVCDRMEYPASPMFDAYPDRIFVYRMRDEAEAKAVGRGMEPDRDMAQVLMANEICRRRLLQNARR